VFGPAAYELGGLLADWVRFKRTNLEDARRKVDAILDRRHVTAVNPIPLKHGIPLIEAMAVEDDPGIQKMWAGLMANSLDPEHEIQNAEAVHYASIGI